MQVGEGAEFPMGVDTYSSTTITPLKYGRQCGITKEMVEDGKWDLLTYNIENIGYVAALNEDVLAIASLAAAATASSQLVATVGATCTVPQITGAIKYLEDAFYGGDSRVLGVSTAVAQDMREIDLFVSADRTGTRDAFTQGLIGNVYNTPVFENPLITANYAYMWVPRFAYAFAEKRPLTVEKRTETQRDWTGACISQRIATGYLYKESVVQIATS